PESYRMTHPVGAALVVYRGASYGEQLDTEIVAQERRLEFEVMVLVRDLGWNTGGPSGGAGRGAYEILEAVRLALTGFTVPGARKMHPMKERFVERDKQGGVWVYGISFAITAVAVEAPRAEGLPLFIRGTALESGGQSVVTLGAAPYTFDPSGAIELPYGNILALIATTLIGGPLTEGVDYSVDRVGGVVAALEGGSAGASETIRISFSYAERVVAESGQDEPAG
ncbi:MAG: Gp37 family protein, partial [Candidatus Binataceae bacterium]